MRRIITGAALAAIFLCPAAGFAATAEEKCEAGKNDAAGKYAACIAKAEKGFISTGDSAKYAAALTKCENKLIDTWAKLEAKAVAAGTVCPTTGDQSSVEDFMDACGQSVADAVGGGTLGPDPVTCASDLTTCDTQLDACEAGDTVCSGQLVTCNANLGACNSTLATANAGTAATADVLTGKTFTSSAGVGAAGTMPNNGAVAIVPGTSAQAIAAGYHNGAGSVAGDPDLTAGNIKNGVNIFGVVGNVASGCSLNTASYTDNGNGTITDNVTGLMWEKLSDDGSIHDWDTKYAYFNVGSVKVMSLNSGSFAGYTDWRSPTIKELQTLVNIGTSNPATYSTFNDACAPGCTVTTCSCTQSGVYWSISTYQPTSSTGWAVGFDVGDTIDNNMITHNYARVVRGGS